MYHSITGLLTYKDEGLAVIETGGVGYEILISNSTSQNLVETGNSAALFCKMIVREDEIYLVGFLSVDEKRFFETLMTVSGIGPKQGLRILSEMPVTDIRNAIITSNEGLLSKIKGVGPKTASRIILELKDKIRKLQISDVTHPVSGLDKKKLEILMALRVLGYSDYESRKTIESVFSRPDDVKNKEVEDIIKIILSNMAR